MQTDLAQGSPTLQGSTGGSNRFAWYGALLKERIQDTIARDKKLREAKEFRRFVNVWINSSGLVTRVEILDATDNPELAEALKLALNAMPALREGPPGDMPQPIRLRVTAR